LVSHQTISLQHFHIKPKKKYEETILARCQWLTPVILTTQESEIRRIAVQSQAQANSSQDPISKKISSHTYTHTHTHTHTYEGGGGLVEEKKKQSCGSGLKRG
jgi:hypothetical protein